MRPHGCESCCLPMRHAFFRFEDYVQVAIIIVLCVCVRAACVRETPIQ